MSNEKAFWYLEDTDIMNLFCPIKTKHAHENHHTRTFKKGEFIYMPNEHADKVYFITNGQVKIGAYGDSGKQITKAILNPREVFGEMILMGVEKRRDFAIAVEETTVCILNKNEVNLLLQHYSKLGLFFMQMIGARVLKLEQRLESLIFKDSRTRVIEFLLESAEKHGQPIGYETLVKGFMTHQEIANLTATSRQTVTTVLNELKNKNIITFNRRRLLIRDLKRLAKEGTMLSN
jgi:CRP-like cAMP-binding protein